jgi:hypothetical protein
VGSFTTDFERLIKEGSGNGASLSVRAQGNQEGGAPPPLLGTLKEALETGISLHRGPSGKPGRGLIYLGLMCRRRLEIGISLQRGPIGEPGVGGPFTRNFERYLKEGSGNGASLSVEALSGELGGGAPLLGTKKDM